MNPFFGGRPWPWECWAQSSPQEKGPGGSRGRKGLGTHVDTEVDPIVAVHLLRRPAQGRVQGRIHDELVVAPLEARGLLPVSPTFLIHLCSFTL